ncbi:MAG: DUF4231 domain-containing protein [Candidatus Bipolaricaulota bacterium]
MDLSENSAKNDFSLKCEKALKHCQAQIDWYEKVKIKHRLAYQTSLIATIVLSGITPILILTGDLPALIQALPAALVTVIVSLSGIFQWKENYLRFAYTSQALKSEKIRFETRTSKEYNLKLMDTTALDRFVTRVENITMGEVGEWRALMQETPEPSTED